MSFIKLKHYTVYIQFMHVDHCNMLVYKIYYIFLSQSHTRQETLNVAREAHELRMDGFLFQSLFTSSLRNGWLHLVNCLFVLSILSGCSFSFSFSILWSNISCSSLSKAWEKEVELECPPTDFASSSSLLLLLSSVESGFFVAAGVGVGRGGASGAGGSAGAGAAPLGGPEGPLGGPEDFDAPVAGSEGLMHCHVGQLQQHRRLERQGLKDQLEILVGC